MKRKTRRLPNDYHTLCLQLRAILRLGSADARTGLRYVIRLLYRNLGLKGHIGRQRTKQRL